MAIQTITCGNCGQSAQIITVQPRGSRVGRRMPAAEHKSFLCPNGCSFEEHLDGQV